MLLHLLTFTFFISWVFLLFFHYETADCLSDDVWKADGLYILNDENFETALHDFSIMFVNFYNPDNNRSKLYTHPQMKDAAKMMEDDDIPVAFARMDCNINKEIVSYYNLTRFPTLRLFTVMCCIILCGSIINVALNATPSSERTPKASTSVPSVSAKDH